MKNYNFQYCQKIVVLSKDKSKVLLCRRRSEEDYDGIFSFIGGKMETSDLSIIRGLKREKDEEIGKDCKIKIFPTFTANILFEKTDENLMILPHYLAIYEEGDIEINNEEYSEYAWVPLNELNDFEPKIPRIPDKVNEILELLKIAEEEKFILI